MRIGDWSSDVCSSDLTAGGANSIAIGASASATADRSIVLGLNAMSAEINSVALGANSVADRDNVVAVGASSNQRQIIYVAAGVQATDAVNVSQHKGLTTALGGGANVDGTQGAVTGPSYEIGRASCGERGCQYV